MDGEAGSTGGERYFLRWWWWGCLLYVCISPVDVWVVCGSVNIYIIYVLVNVCIIKRDVA